MPQTITPDKFLHLAEYLPVIDVRSPAEWMQGHIPGAFNIPLFENEERASVGTLFVQTGRDPAVKLGMEIVGKKFGRLMEEAEKHVPGKEMLLHCWRGGMRSESLAWFYEKLGYTVYLLQGGYKSYRKYIRQEFSQPNKILLLGGMTGSGKTEILNKLSSLGEQVIDLEALANHKGSSFGHLGQQEQPSTEQFENNLYSLWSRVDPTQPLWLEHESNKVGNVFLPDTFFSAMQHATLIRVILPVKIRVHRLVNEYACFEKPLLEAALLNIRDFMGTLQTKLSLEALNRGDFETVASFTLAYYDKTYENALKKRPTGIVHEIEFENDDAGNNALQLIEFVKTLDIL